MRNFLRENEREDRSTVKIVRAVFPLIHTVHMASIGFDIKRETHEDVGGHVTSRYM